MAYVDPDYKTKKEFKEAVEAGVEHWPYVHGGMFECKRNGGETIEGPHYPKAHMWHVRVAIEDGVVVKVL